MLENIINDYNISSIRNIIIGTPLENRVFLWGGYIRDTYFGTVPKDIDIIVILDENKSPISIFSKIFKLNPDEILVTSSFTYQFNFNNLKLDIRIRYKTSDITCKEILYNNCILVDFTINTLIIDICGSGEVLDLTGFGLNDLKNRNIRLGNPSLKETFERYPSRIMRLVRLSTQFELRVSSDIIFYIKNNKYLFNFIDRQIVIDEYKRILNCKNSNEGISFLNLLDMNPTSLDRGLIYFGTGWHEIEPGVVPNRYFEGEKFRWTTDRCEIYITNKVKALKIIFIINNYYKDYPVEYFFNDDLTNKFTIPTLNGLNSYIFDVENINKITIISKTFVPSEHENSNDTRELGIYVKSFSAFTNSGEIHIPMQQISYLI